LLRFTLLRCLLLRYVYVVTLFGFAFTLRLNVYCAFTPLLPHITAVPHAHHTTRWVHTVYRRCFTLPNARAGHCAFAGCSYYEHATAFYAWVLPCLTFTTLATARCHRATYTARHTATFWMLPSPFLCRACHYTLPFALPGGYALRSYMPLLPTYAHHARCAYWLRTFTTATQFARVAAPHYAHAFTCVRAGVLRCHSSRYHTLRVFFCPTFTLFCYLLRFVCSYIYTPTRLPHTLLHFGLVWLRFGLVHIHVTRLPTGLVRAYALSQHRAGFTTGTLVAFAAMPRYVPAARRTCARRATRLRRATTTYAAPRTIHFFGWFTFPTVCSSRLRTFAVWLRFGLPHIWLGSRLRFAHTVVPFQLRLRSRFTRLRYYGCVYGWVTHPTLVFTHTAHYTLHVLHPVYTCLVGFGSLHFCLPVWLVTLHGYAHFAVHGSLHRSHTLFAAHAHTHPLPSSTRALWFAGFLRFIRLVWFGLRGLPRTPHRAAFTTHAAAAHTHGLPLLPHAHTAFAALPACAHYAHAHTLPAHRAHRRTAAFWFPHTAHHTRFITCGFAPRVFASVLFTVCGGFTHAARTAHTGTTHTPCTPTWVAGFCTHPAHTYWFLHTHRAALFTRTLHLHRTHTRTTPSFGLVKRLRCTRNVLPGFRFCTHTAVCTRSHTVSYTHFRKRLQFYSYTPHGLLPHPAHTFTCTHAHHRTTPPRTHHTYTATARWFARFGLFTPYPLHTHTCPTHTTTLHTPHTHTLYTHSLTFVHTFGYHYLPWFKFFGLVTPHVGWVLRLVLRFTRWFWITRTHTHTAHTSHTRFTLTFWLHARLVPRTWRLGSTLGLTTRTAALPTRFTVRLRFGYHCLHFCTAYPLPATHYSTGHLHATATHTCPTPRKLGTTPPAPRRRTRFLPCPPLVTPLVRLLLSFIWFLQFWFSRPAPPGSYTYMVWLCRHAYCATRYPPGWAAPRRFAARAATFQFLPTLPGVPVFYAHCASLPRRAVPRRRPFAAYHRVLPPRYTHAAFLLIATYLP